MFSTTRWTIIQQAAQKDSQFGKDAWAQIVQKYWNPLYFFARQQGLATQDAEDATQEFLMQMIDSELLNAADPARGRFRNYLLTAWKRFLIDQHRSGNRLRRGGLIKHEPIHSDRGEERMLNVVSKNTAPDVAFARGWATAIIDEARSRLRSDYAASGRYQTYDRLIPLLTQTVTTLQYDQLAKELQLSQGAVKVAMHRIRQRFGESLREVVAETVDDPADIGTELNDLLGILSQPEFQK